MTAAITGRVLDLQDSDGRIPAVQSGESCRIVAQLSEDGVDITKAYLISLTLTLYNEATGTILNSRQDQDILDTNGGSVDANGEITLVLDPGDNGIVGDVEIGGVERHIARLKWTWTSGVVELTGIQELRFAVQRVRSFAA